MCWYEVGDVLIRMWLYKRYTNENRSTENWSGQRSLHQIVMDAIH